MKWSWVDNLPPSIIEAVSGDGFLLVRTWTGVYLWRNGEDPIVLPAPRYVWGISAMSVSPSGQYVVVVYDRDIPYGTMPGSRRAGDIRVYDLTGSQIAQWPQEPEPDKPSIHYGLFLFGWADPATLRFVHVYHGDFTAKTWTLAEDAPAERREKQTMISYPAVSRDGSWVAYRSTPEQVVVEQVSTPAERVVIAQSAPSKGFDDPRFLLNGHVAFRGWERGIWWELLSDGTWQRWENVEELF